MREVREGRDCIGREISDVAKIIVQLAKDILWRLSAKYKQFNNARPKPAPGGTFLTRRTTQNY